MIFGERSESATVPEADKQAFVGYYNKNSIIPVSQDIDDPDFIFRRDALYRMLGVSLSNLTGRRVIEMGPGGGFNATAIIRRRPKLYVMVDASRASLAELERKQSLGVFGNVNVEIIDSNIFDFHDPRDFELVIVEGVIPGQTRPKEMLRHVSSFVTPGGNIVCTSTSASSWLSEVCRRVFRPYIQGLARSFEEQVEVAASIFGPHLATLGVRTRPAKDWVLDTIFHDFERGAQVIFTASDTYDALGREFDFVGSSPKFLIDDRFYKQLSRSSRTSGDLLVEQLPRISPGLLDYRVNLHEAMQESVSSDLEAICEDLFHVQEEIVRDGSYAHYGEFARRLSEVDLMLPPCSWRTSLAIKDFLTGFERALNGDSALGLSEFSSWWGRGQQYLNFVRIDW